MSKGRSKSASTTKAQGPWWADPKRKAAVAKKISRALMGHSRAAPTPISLGQLLSPRRQSAATLSCSVPTIIRLEREGKLQRAVLATLSLRRLPYTESITTLGLMENRVVRLRRPTWLMLPVLFL